MVLLYAKYLAKASNKVAFLLSFIAAISLLISGLVLNLPNQLGCTVLLILLLSVEGWLVLSVKHSKTAQCLFYLKCRANITLKISG